MTTSDQLQSPQQLSGHHQRTYEAVLRHPTAHDLEWHDLRSMLGALTEVSEGNNGSIQAKRNGQIVILHPPNHKAAATVEDVLAVRRFLTESAELAPTHPGAAVAPGAHVLVVIDHHEAKIYRTELSGAVPQHLVPHDPHGFGRHLHAANEWTDGKRHPERKSFYEAVAKTLRGADQILLFGCGTGESSAMEQLLADLKAHHTDIAAKIIGSVRVDAHHTTENELLARARTFYAELSQK